MLARLVSAESGKFQSTNFTFYGRDRSVLLFGYTMRTDAEIPDFNLAQAAERHRMLRSCSFSAYRS